MIIDQTLSNYVIENLPDKIKLTIQGRKKWGWFLGLLFTFVMNGLCFFPFVIYFTTFFIQEYLHLNIVTIIAGVLLILLYFYTIRRKFLELVDNVLDNEIIEVSESQIIVERSGFFGLKTKKIILADDIKGITGSLVLGNQLSFVNNIPFATSSLGSIVIWKRKSSFHPFWFYGKGLSHSNAQLVLEAILQKYPKYRFTEVAQQQIQAG